MRLTTDFHNIIVSSNVKRTLLFVRIQFGQELVTVHTGVGIRHLDGLAYYGLGELASISTFKESGGKSANRLNLSISSDDPALFESAINQNPIGGDVDVYLVGLNDNRNIEETCLLFSGEVADYAVKKGSPFQVTVVASDWFEVWSKPVDNARYTHESQQLRYTDDLIFNQIETIAQHGINDTVPGKRIGGGGGIDDNRNWKQR